MRKGLLAFVLAASVTLFTQACGEEPCTAIMPEIDSSSPFIDGANDVSSSAAFLRVNFNTRLEDGRGNVSVQPDVGSSWVWGDTFTDIRVNFPADSLQGDTQYTITLSDFGNCAGAVNETITFTTAPDVLPPSPTLNTPNQLGGAPQPDTNIVVDWDQTMNETVGSVTFVAPDGHPYTTEWSNGSTRLTINPNTNLPAEETVLIQLSGFQAVSGDFQAPDPFSISFTTARDESPPNLVRVENQNAEVLESGTAIIDARTPGGEVLTFFFDESMDDSPGQVAKRSVDVSDGNGGTITIEGEYINGATPPRSQLQVDLGSNTGALNFDDCGEATITLPATLVDVAQNALTPVVFEFRQFAPEAQPLLGNAIPPDGSFDVNPSPTNLTFFIPFDADMDTSITPVVAINPAQVAAPTANWASSRELEITVAEQLPDGETQVTFTISNLVDLCGRDLAETAPLTYNFRTSLNACMEPMVITTPADNATGVSVTETFQIQFATGQMEVMGSVTIEDDSTPPIQVNGTGSWTSQNTYEFVPAALLDVSTTYTASLVGFVESGTNCAVSAQSVSFTTSASRCGTVDHTEAETGGTETNSIRILPNPPEATNETITNFGDSFVVDGTLSAPPHPGFNLGVDIHDGDTFEFSTGAAGGTVLTRFSVLHDGVMGDEDIVLLVWEGTSIATGTLLQQVTCPQNGDCTDAIWLELQGGTDHMVEVLYLEDAAIANPVDVSYCITTEVYQTDPGCPDPGTGNYDEQAEPNGGNFYIGAQGQTEDIGFTAGALNDSTIVTGCLGDNPAVGMFNAAPFDAIDVDSYQIILTNRFVMDFDISWTAANPISINIVDVNAGITTTAATTGATSPETISRILEPGTYDIHVFRRGDYTVDQGGADDNYVLTMTAQNCTSTLTDSYTEAETIAAPAVNDYLTYDNTDNPQFRTTIPTTFLGEDTMFTLTPGTEYTITGNAAASAVGNGFGVAGDAQRDSDAFEFTTTDTVNVEFNLSWTSATNADLDLALHIVVPPNNVNVTLNDLANNTTSFSRVATLGAGTWTVSVMGKGSAVQTTAEPYTLTMEVCS